MDEYNPADDAPKRPDPDDACGRCDKPFGEHEQTGELASYTGAPEEYVDVFWCPDGSGDFVPAAQIGGRS